MNLKEAAALVRVAEAAEQVATEHYTACHAAIGPAETEMYRCQAVTGKARKDLLDAARSDGDA